MFEANNKSGTFTLTSVFSRSEVFFKSARKRCGSDGGVCEAKPDSNSTQRQRHVRNDATGRICPSVDYYIAGDGSCCSTQATGQQRKQAPRHKAPISTKKPSLTKSNDYAAWVNRTTSVFTRVRVSSVLRYWCRNLFTSPDPNPPGTRISSLSSSCKSLCFFWLLEVVRFSSKLPNLCSQVVFCRQMTPRAGAQFRFQIIDVKPSAAAAAAGFSASTLENPATSNRIARTPALLFLLLVLLLLFAPSTDYTYNGT